MKTKEEIAKELNEFSKILKVWDYRLGNNDSIDNTFLSESFEDLLQKSTSTLEKYNIPENNLNNFDNYDSLNTKDLLILLIAGCIGAIIPKLTSEFFDNIHETLSKSNGLLGKFFSHKGEWIDSVVRDDDRRVIKGTFHRFRPDGKHDLLNFSGLIASIKQFGVLQGTIKFIIHILLDCCSSTGIPLPGTSNFLYLIREKFGMRLFSLKDQSYWSAIRMGDFMQVGVTSSILLTYERFEKIPQDSLRLPQLGLWAHGVSLVGATYIATQTSNVTMLSKISYPACIMFVKNFISFHNKLSKITKESNRLDKEIDLLINDEPNFRISQY